MIDLSEAKWTFAQAAQLAGYEKLNTLRSYFQKGWFRIIGRPPASKGRGSAELLSLYDVLSLAVAKHLIDLGAVPRLAFEAGVSFGHFGDASRDPGELYGSGFTVMVYFPSDGATRILRVKSAVELAELFSHPRSGKREGSIQLLLNDVERSVFLQLEGFQ